MAEKHCGELHSRRQTPYVLAPDGPGDAFDFGGLPTQCTVYIGQTDNADTQARNKRQLKECWNHKDM